MIWTFQPSIFRYFRGYVKLGCIHYVYTYQPPSRARKEIFAEKIGLSWFLSLMLVWEIRYVTLGLYRRSFFFRENGAPMISWKIPSFNDHSTIPPKTNGWTPQKRSLKTANKGHSEEPVALWLNSSVKPLSNKKRPKRLLVGYVEDELLPSYMWIIINHWKDPIKQSGIMENNRAFSWLTLIDPWD